MEIKVSIVGILRGKYERSGNSFPLSAAVAELVDNSVDAGASRVQIEEKGKSLIFRDNGKGFQSIADSLVIGQSDKEGQIGRYGVGLKDAALRYSTSTKIRSNGHSVTIPWEAIICGDIRIEDVESPSICSKDEWTEIEFLGFTKRYSGSVQTDKIQRIYGPKLSSGELMVEVNGEKLKPLPLPVFTESIDHAFSFIGKSARIVGGIFKPSDPGRRHWLGYHVYYQGRLIGDGRITDRGVGDEACTSFCFIIHIDDGGLEPWHLSTNKDASEDIDDLLEYVHAEFTWELLKKAANQAREVEVMETERAVNEAAKAIGGLDAGNRKQGAIVRHPGAAEETGSGPKKVRTRTADTDGPYERVGGAHRKKHFIFRMEELGGDTLGLVSVGKGEKLTIEFNLSNPWVDSNKSNEDAVTPLAVMAYHTFTICKKSDLLPSDVTNSILECTGKHLAIIQPKET